MTKNICCTCDCEDKAGLINGMCTDCYDMSLDIGKGFSKAQKASLKRRRKFSERDQKSGRV